MKSQETAISELNDGWSDEQVYEEIEKIMAERQGMQVIDENINKEENIENMGNQE